MIDSLIERVKAARKNIQPSSVFAGAEQNRLVLMVLCDVMLEVLAQLRKTE